MIRFLRRAQELADAYRRASIDASRLDLVHVREINRLQAAIKRKNRTINKLRYDLGRAQADAIEARADLQTRLNVECSTARQPGEASALSSMDGALQARNATFGPNFTIKQCNGFRPEYFVHGPEGSFYVDTAEQAETVIRERGFDRDEWIITEQPGADKSPCDCGGEPGPCRCFPVG